MNSSRPYLVRALYEWIVDNDCTPHMLVNAEYPKVQVPDGFASDGQIVLNVSPSAVRSLHMDNDAVSFEGRFGGVPHSLFVPIGAVLGIYARENGQKGSLTRLTAGRPCAVFRHGDRTRRLCVVLFACSAGE